MGLTNSSKAQPIPMFSSKVLHAYLHSKPYHECRQFKFNYCLVIVKLNYIAQTLQVDIIFTVHKVARFSADPREEHGEAVIYLCIYMNKTCPLGLQFKLDPSTGFVCNADAAFACTYIHDFAAIDGIFSMLHAPFQVADSSGSKYN